MTASLPFSHLRVVVAGGASGIGKAVATSLVREGADVTVFDRDRQNAKKLASTQLGPRPITAVETDVTDRDSLQEAIKEVAKSGLVTTLVNCVGVNRFAEVDEFGFDDWDELVAINLTGAWNLTHGLLPHISPEHGAIVFISSVSGISGIPKAAPYTAAKHGIVGLTRALALDLGPRGVTVNAICPGVIGTPLLVAATTETFRTQALERTPLRRLGAPEDVAAAVSFLVSPNARWITGTAIPVDGGLTCGIRATHWE